MYPFAVRRSIRTTLWPPNVGGVERHLRVAPPHTHRPVLERGSRIQAVDVVVRQHQIGPVVVELPRLEPLPEPGFEGGERLIGRDEQGHPVAIIADPLRRPIPHVEPRRG